MSTNGRIRAAYMQQFAKDELFPLLASHPSLDVAAARNAAELRDILPGAELLIANNRFYDEEVGRIVMALGRICAGSSSGPPASSAASVSACRAASRSAPRPA